MSVIHQRVDIYIQTFKKVCYIKHITVYIQISENLSTLELVIFLIETNKL